MREVFAARNLVFWWGIATTFIFLEGWMKRAAAFLQTPGLFDPTKMPFNILPSINGLIDQFAELLVRRVGFDPAAPLLTIGAIVIPNLALAIFFGIIILVVVIGFYFKAVAAHGLLDDFMAMAAVYFIFRLEGDIAEVLLQPHAIAELLRDPFIYLAALTVFLLMMLMAGKGFTDSKVFWKVVGEGTALYIFFFPKQVADALARLLAWAAEFGPFLRANTFFPEGVGLVLWAVLGVILLAPRLYDIGRPPASVMTTEQEIAGGLEEEIQRALRRRRRR